MSRKPRSNGKKSRRQFVQKPNGVLHPRVQKVGPEHFGIVSVDCAKARSKWMLCDFYGNVLIEPTEVTHAKGHFDAAIARFHDSIEKHRLKDQIVVIERTGNYHLPVKRAYAAAGFETRIVHPFATKQFRQPADPGNKTDDTDLLAIFRAAISGFGLTELPLSDTYQELRHITRHRRDLVQKRSALCCQIKEHLEAVMPGYAACFDDLWKSHVALVIVRNFGSPEALLQAGVQNVCIRLQEAGHRFQRKTVDKVLAWANMAASPDPAATVHQRIWQALDDDRLQKTREIQALERDIAQVLAKTPYILLLSFPGINVVSAGEFAGEMGPIDHYSGPKAITGRAGLFPSRYQSDQVDIANGKLIRCANRGLRSILMIIATNLMKCNSHFRSLTAVWKAQGKDPRHSRVRIASRFSRIAYQIVAGRQVFKHPSCRGRDYVLQKLQTFLQDHDTSVTNTIAILEAAIEQIPKSEYTDEAAPLQEQLRKNLSAKRGPKHISEILTVVLAKLGVSDVQLSSSEDQDLG